MRESKVFRTGGGIQTSVIVSMEMYDLSKTHRIKFSEALRRGIALMLAEKGITEYQNDLNITRLLKEAKLKAKESAELIYKLENGNNPNTETR